jgi:hypothetical protein
MKRKAPSGFNTSLFGIVPLDGDMSNDISCNKSPASRLPSMDVHVLVPSKSDPQSVIVRNLDWLHMRGGVEHLLLQSRIFLENYSSSRYISGLTAKVQRRCEVGL